MKPIARADITVTETTPDHLPPDLTENYEVEGGTPYAVTVEGYPEGGTVLTLDGRAGVAWGADSIWIDLKAGETAEDAARIVLNDADETERRA